MNIRILVVDDIADNVKLLTYDLEDAGYDVLTASDGEEALSLIHQEGPQVVLTDWMMPKMDGLALCRAIRASEGVGFVYIVMLTALTDKSRLVEAFEAGADDFLTKPIYQPELMARLRAGLRIVDLQFQLTRERHDTHKANAQLAVLNEKLNVMATTDALTGLGNRREAMQRVDDCWAYAQRHEQPLSCMLFDIDHFKRCNDVHGHDFGDVVLQQTARVIRSTARAGERPFRIGGEEFLILCPASGVEEALYAAERLRNNVEMHTVLHNDVSVSVTISVGVAEKNPSPETPADLLKTADEALYAAKDGGRNRVCCGSQLDRVGNER